MKYENMNSDFYAKKILFCGRHSELCKSSRFKKTHVNYNVVQILEILLNFEPMPYLFPFCKALLKMIL